jgi:hypothetical protein
VDHGVNSLASSEKYGRGSFFFRYLQDFKKWRDPDSNRGHHDFQLGKARSPLFLTAQKSAWITGAYIMHEH